MLTTMCALFNHQFTGRAAEAIRTHGADIVETQEGTYPMIVALMELLPEYDRIGVGRLRDHGELLRKIVQKRLGHSQINVRWGTYCHVPASLPKDAAGCLDNGLRLRKIGTTFLRASLRHTKKPSRKHSWRAFSLVGPLGLEPRTPGLKVRCSNQLSYGPTHVYVGVAAKV